MTDLYPEVNDPNDHGAADVSGSGQTTLTQEEWSVSNAAGAVSSSVTDTADRTVTSNPDTGTGGGTAGTAWPNPATPGPPAPRVPRYVQKTETHDEIITDYSAESLTAYEAAGAVAIAVYDDGTEAEVAWSEVRDPLPTPEEVLFDWGSEVDAKIDVVQDDIDAFKSTAAATYATKTELDDETGAITRTIQADYLSKSDAGTTYATKSEVSSSVNSLSSTIASTYETQSHASQTYATQTQLTQTDTSIRSEISDSLQDAKDYADDAVAGEASARASAITQSANGITQSVASTYETQAHAAQTYATQAALSTQADRITAEVTARQATDDELDALSTTVSETATGLTTEITRRRAAQVVYATCGTGAQYAAKVATVQGNADFALATGVKVAVLFSYANTASSPTLKVGDTDAKQIRAGGSALTGTSASNWNANTIVTFVYDGSYWAMAETTALAKAGTALTNSSTALSGVNEVKTMIRDFSGGTLVCKVGDAVGALVNASGSFDVVGLTWSDGEPTISKTLATYGESVVVGDAGNTSIELTDTLMTVYCEGVELFNVGIEQYGDNLEHGRPILSFMEGDFRVDKYGLVEANRLSASEMRHTAYRCETAADTAVKQVSGVGLREPVAGMRILVSFKYANTASAPKLSYGTSSEYASRWIFVNGQPVGANNPFKWTAGTVLEFELEYDDEYGWVWFFTGNVNGWGTNAYYMHSLPEFYYPGLTASTKPAEANVPVRPCRVVCGDGSVWLYAPDNVSNVHSGKLPIANGGTGADDAAEARANLAVVGIKYANNYWGMTLADGTDAGWIRTTQNGVIPYSSDSTNGKSSIGTSTWPFADGYFKKINGVEPKLTDTTYSDATTSAHGLMTAADKTKLNAIGSRVTKSNNQSAGTGAGTGAATSVSSGTAKSVASVSLAAGTWIMVGTIHFPTNNTGIRRAALNNINNSNANTSTSTATQFGGNGVTIIQKVRIVNHTATTVYYLSAYQNSGSALNCEGTIEAIRIA